MKRRVVACVIAVTFATLAQAEVPDKAPAASRAQVANALKELAPAYAGVTRTAGAPGTIEAAISAYAPGGFHPVNEGSLPPFAAAGSTCPGSGEMALVFGRFCVDKWEAYLVEAGEKVLSPYHPPAGGRVYYARSAAGVVPQGYVSAQQGDLACKAAGKRLCQPVEWRAACGGSQGYAFPYGPKRVENKCHDTGSSPMVLLHGASLDKGLGVEDLNDPKANQVEGGLAKTGAYPDCVSDQGVYDMVGNLDEWTADAHGTFQGGYWLDTSQHGDGCAYRTIAHDFGYHDYSTGFRCCADVIPPGGPAPAPASMSLPSFW